MIRLTAMVACDGRDCFRTVSLKPGYDNIVWRRDIEAIRAAAAQKGWRRFRLANTGPNGDYCPECQARIARERAAAIPAGKGRHPERSRS